MDSRPVLEDSAARARPPIVREATTMGAFAAAYALAVLLGRATVQPESVISLVWPAAGISVLWITARAGRPWLALDVLVMGALTIAMVSATGGSLTAAVASGIGAVVQAAVCCVIIARRCPQVWRSRGGRMVDRSELWWFFFAATMGPLVSAPAVAASSLLSGDGWQWDVILLWCARNMGSIVVICPLGFVIGALVRRYRRRRAGATYARRRWTLRSRPWEWIAVLILSPAMHAAWFLAFDDVALVFPLLVLACWAGARLPAGLVTLHGGLVAVACIGITAMGRGPFLGIGDPIIEVAVAQLYVVLVCAIGLALALDRDERDKLAGALSTSRDQAQSQADLFSTIVNTMSEGVRVVDREGRMVVRNPAATRLLLGTHHSSAHDGAPADPDDERDLAGIRNIDGSALEPVDLPFRKSLAGRDVQDLALLVRPGDGTDTADERIVSFTTARLPATAGSGVVTVLRDVTVERQELHRAAQVQMSLLPTEVPQLPGYELAAHFVPAGSVGGDFYDWYGVDDGLVLTLADVMGKGPGAAILAATTRSLLRAHGDSADVVSPMAAAEQGMARDLDNTNAFVTMFRAHLHAPTGTITYSDAGHGLAAVVTEDGVVRRLRANGLPLGISVEDRRSSETEVLEPGDVLLVLSDGVLDAMGGALEDLAPVWERAAHSKSASDAVSAAVALASQGEIDDDLTVLALKRLH